MVKLNTAIESKRKTVALFCCPKGSDFYGNLSLQYQNYQSSAEGVCENKALVFVMVGTRHFHHTPFAYLSFMLRQALT